jgi:dihydrofolate synthase/folylpolyglutamate synthase
MGRGGGGDDDDNDEEGEKEFQNTFRTWKKRGQEVHKLEKEAKKYGMYDELRKELEQESYRYQDDVGDSEEEDEEEKEGEDVEDDEEEEEGDVERSNDENKQLGDALADSMQLYTDYEMAVRKLYTINMYHPVKLGLDNIQFLHGSMGNPMDRIPVVHVAGSNGKGSVCLKIAKTLQLSNPKLKVGLFTSPHISCFRERVQINGEMIPEDDVAAILPELYEICREHDIPATFFELTTAMAFAYFTAEEVDVVVLEVGLGGRLDATNVIAAPALSVITSISLEHTRILGNTIEKIAKEKAGIIKENCPVLVGPHCPHDVIRSCAEEKKASQYYTCEDVLGPLPLEDDYDLENAQIARAAVKILQERIPNVVSNIPDDIIEQGTSQRPPCRFEYGSITGFEYILDVAHNPSAMAYLARKLKKTYPHKKFRVVVGMSADKDIKQCMKHILDIVEGDSSRIYLTEAEHPRAAKLAQVLEATASLDMKNANYHLDNPEIVDMILLAAEESRNENGEDDIIVVCGSIFLMSAARESWLIDVPIDSPAITQCFGVNLRAGQENFGNSTYPLPSDK